MEKTAEKTYTVCHDCQLTGGGIIHCAHADTCGETKSYPNKLRELVEVWYKTKIPLSIICEKSFDLGQEYASQSPVVDGGVEEAAICWADRMNPVSRGSTTWSTDKESFIAGAAYQKEQQEKK